MYQYAGLQSESKCILSPSVLLEFTPSGEILPWLLASGQAFGSPMTFLFILIVVFL